MHGRVLNMILGHVLIGIVQVNILVGLKDEVTSSTDESLC